MQYYQRVNDLQKISVDSVEIAHEEMIVITLFKREKPLDNFMPVKVIDIRFNREKDVMIEYAVSYNFTNE